MHPWTFVFILVTVFCVGFMLGLRFGVVVCNHALREIREKLHETADLLHEATRK
jgi:ABC-type sulfate transport system permease component